MVPLLIRHTPLFYRRAIWNGVRYFPKGIFPSGNLPNVQFPKRQLPKCTFSQMTISQVASSPWGKKDIFPMKELGSIKWTFKFHIFKRISQLFLENTKLKKSSFSFSQLVMAKTFWRPTQFLQRVKMYKTIDLYYYVRLG